MFKHEGLDMAQQLLQLFKPLLRILFYVCKFPLADRELFDTGECTVFVKSVVNVWGLGKVQLGVRSWPVQTIAAVGFYL